MFFGYSFCLDATAHTEASGSLKQLKTVDVKNVVLDDIFIQEDSSYVVYDVDGNPTQYASLEEFKPLNENHWDKYTALHGQFNKNGDLDAGNIKYKPEDVERIRLKRRKQGDLKWQTIYERDVNPTADDPFNIIYMDYLEPGNTWIEYTYTFVIGNAEYDSNVRSVYSEFSDYFIVGADIVNNEVSNTVYHAIANVVNTPKYNRASNTVVCPGSKYPYVINNGIAQYYSGTFNAIFFPVLNCCDFDAENAWVFRNGLDVFLANGQAKIIKKFDGNIWLANIVGDITRSDGDHYQCEVQEFEWAECGNAWDTGDLYDNGFILTDVDRGD